MGGAATHVAAERYGNRFDGALALCGAASQTPATAITADFFAAAAFVAGVRQREFERSRSVSRLIRERIRPALRRARAQRRFEDIMLSLTGGPRPFGLEGFRAEEETNWTRGELLLSAGLADNRRTVYRLGAPSPVSSREFNRAVIRLRPVPAARRAFLAGNETSGRLAMPLLSLYTTGDGQVPIEQARILRRKVAAADRQRLLVQRVFRDPGHCGFTSPEWTAGLEALVRWVERGGRPRGHDVLSGRLGDLRPRFELSPRAGTPEGDKVPGARRRVVLSGRLRLNGRRFDARFLGAVVRKDGLVTPCQLTLPLVRGGRYAITVVASGESAGCGRPGAEIALWTFADGKILFSRRTHDWPRTRRAQLEFSFSRSRPNGVIGARTEFAGQVFRPNGRQLPGGTRIDAYVGSTRCGVASVRPTGSYAGFSLNVVGPDAIPGCTRGGTITFRVNGRRALDTATNEPGTAGQLDLTIP
jgi:hypothetical protein